MGNNDERIVFKFFPFLFTVYVAAGWGLYVCYDLRIYGDCVVWHENGYRIEDIGSDRI